MVNEREGPSSDQSLRSPGELELEDISDGEIEQVGGVAYGWGQ